MEEKKKSKINGKRKGSREENKQAKLLSKWMFNGDEDVLDRHRTSGAIKTVYTGDIVPIKMIGWSCFPFIFEIKSGYEKFIPTIYKYDIISDWYKLCRLDGSKTGQDIIIMICQFYNKKALFITDQQLRFDYIIYQATIPIKFENHFEIAYIYFWEEVQKLSFEKLFETVNIRGIEIEFKKLISNQN